MAILAWVMMGLAVWHFAILLPDRFWGGIVGAFFGAVSARSSSARRQRAAVPGRDDTDMLTALEAIPGAMLGIAAVTRGRAARGRAGS